MNWAVAWRPLAERDLIDCAAHRSSGRDERRASTEGRPMTPPWPSWSKTTRPKGRGSKRSAAGRLGGANFAPRDLLLRAIGAACLAARSRSATVESARAAPNLNLSGPE